MKWQVKMGWHNALFLHWKIAPDVLRPLLPPTVELDLFGDHAWLGIVAFEMHDVRRRWLPRVPGMLSFPEINVRTYCRHGGIDGIFFLSLDTPEFFTRTFGKRHFHLPYRKRRMDYEITANSSTRYRSYHPDGKLEFDACYEPADDGAEELTAFAPSDFIHWSSERYSLYSQTPDGTLMRGDVEHPPWPTSQVAFELATNHLLTSYMGPATTPDAAHYSTGVDTFAGGLVKP
ncbi:MAG: DUF2071 domain-containing protein [Planctomycetaceae bacterium]|jgi:uncharacterized protein|nr:DUF2071 domain-containing protein [Planctomycetaceae bacterium]MBT4725316.1 DUF2071 domain-containing protein [Planctomycetaceae bacterium]MBT4845689.1 DUF2071 domain-containing protein [Planctomycetaceae bacterium]MBT5123271.1 DUF2071 domain-containing protein [Planctomycetaceae bacterium]MBT5600089.1 DUF2071 domain-containing protein [Planctomycetaceae bacterium]